MLVGAAERCRPLVAQALDDVGARPRVALGAHAAALHVGRGEPAHVLEELPRVDVRGRPCPSRQGRAQPPRLEEGGGADPGREEGEDGQAPQDSAAGRPAHAHDLDRNRMTAAGE